MVETIIKTSVSVIVSGVIGYCISQIKGLRSIKQSLMIMLQSNLTNTYFAYEKMGKIPDYVYKNWLNELKGYESLNGDDYVHVLADKMKSWEIVKTDILERDK